MNFILSVNKTLPLPHLSVVAESSNTSSPSQPEVPPFIPASFDPDHHH